MSKQEHQNWFKLGKRIKLGFSFGFHNGVVTKQEKI